MVGCADAAALPAISATRPITAARGYKTLTADALDRGTTRAELVLQPLEAAIKMIDTVDHGFAFGSQRRDHQRYGGAKIRRHNRCALEAIDAFDDRSFAIQIDSRAQPYQLLHMHK